MLQHIPIIIENNRLFQLAQSFVQLKGQLLILSHVDDQSSCFQIFKIIQSHKSRVNDRDIGGKIAVMFDSLCRLLGWLETNAKFHAAGVLAVNRTEYI